MFKFEDSGRLSRLGGGALVFAGGLSFLLLSPNGLSDRGFSQFVNETCAAVAVVFPLFVCAFLRYRYGHSFGKMLLVLALPIGLLYTNVGLIGMVAGTTGSETIGPASRSLLE